MVSCVSQKDRVVVNVKRKEGRNAQSVHSDASVNDHNGDTLSKGSF